MNEYYYYTMIRDFIPKSERAILTRHDRHYISLKSKKRRLLNASIYLHQGSACYRYCYCKYFNDKSTVEIYNDKYNLDEL